jgi:hypothetical protein
MVLVDGDWWMKAGCEKVVAVLRIEGIDVIERRVVLRRSHGRMKLGMECEALKAGDDVRLVEKGWALV